MNKRPVIYRLLDPRTNAVRYIGVASNLQKRFHYHLWEVRQGKQTHKCRWLRQLANLNLEPIVEVVETIKPWDSWQERERFWIAYYKREGAQLTNSAEGGGGSSSPLPDSTREKMRQSALGKVRTPEHCANISKSKKGKSIKRHSAEVELRRSVSIQITMRKLWKDPEYRKGPQGIKRFELVIWAGGGVSTFICDAKTKTSATKGFYKRLRAKGGSSVGVRIKEVYQIDNNGERVSVASFDLPWPSPTQTAQVATPGRKFAQGE